MSKRSISEIVKDIVDSGIRVEDIISAMKDSDYRAIKEKITENIKNLKERYKKEFIGKYLMVSSSNIDLVSDFSNNIDVEDLIPMIQGKIIKVSNVSVYQQNSRSDRFIIDFSGDCLKFDIKGVDSDIDSDPLDYYNTSISYVDKFNTSSKIIMLVDWDGNLISNIDNFKEVTKDLILELLDYYKHSSEYGIKFLKNRFEL